MVEKYLIPKGKLRITSDIDIEGFERVVTLQEVMKEIEKFEGKEAFGTYPLIIPNKERHMIWLEDDWKELKKQLGIE